MAGVMRRRAICFGLLALALLTMSACGRRTVSETDGPPPTGVIAGRVIAGPTCPVERVDHPCPPSPVVAEVQARIGDRIIASTNSNHDGSYRLKLPRGTYTIIAVTHGTFPHCAARTITVAASSTAFADISCDTGIR